jgi:hypothetical protein
MFLKIIMAVNTTALWKTGLRELQLLLSLIQTNFPIIPLRTKNMQHLQGQIKKVNEKLSWCMLWKHITWAQVQPYPFSTSALDGGEWLPHATTPLPNNKEQLVHTQ